MHKRRIARGARWLDQHEPDWFTRVNKRLDPYDPHTCVLGQVFGDFDQFMGRRYLMPKSDSWLIVLHPGFLLGECFIFAYGFAVIRETDRQWSEAWREEIRRRKEAAETLYVPETFPTPAPLGEETWSSGTIGAARG